MKKALIVAVMIVFSSQAFAEKLSLGWMNIQPCSKTEWDNRGIFGLPSPTVRWGEQRATLFLDIRASDMQKVRNDLSNCAQRAVVVATLASLVTNLSGAAPAFWAEFQSCTSNVDWADASLSVETSCHY